IDPLSLTTLRWAIYSLLLRKRPDGRSQDAVLGASIAAALVFLVPITLVVPPGLQLAHAPAIWLAVLYIAVVASSLAYRFLSFGVATIGPARSGQFVHLMPVFGPILAVALLGGTAPAQIAGEAARACRRGTGQPSTQLTGRLAGTTRR
ncbi:MAG: EamA family transporter, partial [Alphaproteobacteria bacterium]